MSSHPSPGGLDEGDIRILKVFKFISCEGRKLLMFVFCKGCPKLGHETVEKYLKSKGMTNQDYRKYFDSSMRKKIQDDPSGKNFDVSLLHAVIKNACEKVAPPHEAEKWSITGDQLENYCSRIKHERNCIAHGSKFPDEDAMTNKLEFLRDLLEKGYKSAGNCYSITSSTINNEIKRMNANFEQIKDAPGIPVDANKYQDEIRKLREHFENYMKTNGVVELKEKIKTETNVDPASFISGNETLKVRAIFTNLEVVMEDKALKHENQTHINYKSVLEQKTKKGKTPNIIVIEGEAGAGKSTFTKLILAEWAAMSPSYHTQIRNLESYDMVLYAECKNKFVTNFADLLNLLMPCASYSMSNEDIVRSVLAHRVLLILDGLDELNKTSRQLVEEIMRDKMPRSTAVFHLLLTTRPQALKEVIRLCQKSEWIHMRILGISPEQRPDFVHKMHEEMKKEGMSTEDTQKLEDYVRKSEARLGEHFRLPLNLTLLTYLWAESPEDVNSVTTATHLFLRILQLIECRVVNRIYENHHGDMDEITDSVKEYMEVLNEKCFEEIISESLQLSESSQQTLKGKCKDLNLPYSDMSAAFMNVTREWTATGYVLHLTAPHKSIMEFFAARWIQSCLKRDGPKKKNLKSILEDLKCYESSLPMYQNVLLHLSGLLKDGKCTLDQHAEELVELLTKAGTTEQQWLDIIAESECSESVVKHIAPKIEKTLTVRDGHTGAAASIFSHLLESTPVKVILNCEITYIPHLHNFLEKLANRECVAELHFRHQWKNILCGNSSDLLLNLSKSKCQIQSFTGNLDDLRNLPDDLKKLKIALHSDTQAKKICNEIEEVVKEFDLLYLGVHVIKGISPEALGPLPIINEPKKETGAVWISGVSDEDIDWAVTVAKVLQPPLGKFYSLRFPRSSLTLGGCKELINKLSQHNIVIRPNSRLYVTMASNKTPEVIELRHFAKKKLNCEFDCIDDAVIWSD
ncbi:uncharacterized protein LOC134782390 [Penaeus indicus]|uniref:uncharacterized protein LOC134782390 n=1 Tax=Penaeus indicus TaxID=29960 RepID=UPI00300CFF59